MSRIGKKIIEIPEKTEVEFNGKTLSVKGPQGELTRDFRDEIKIVIEDKEIKTEPKDSEDRFANALWGTYASHIQNMITGVNQGFEKKLVVEGVGFKSEVSGDKLVLALGFSHPIEIKIPEGLKVVAEKNNISISGIDKELVGSFAAQVRAKRKPEPYKGKGVRYEGEIVRMKQGKKSA